MSLPAPVQVAGVSLSGREPYTISAEENAALCKSIDRVEPYLTLQGLQIAHELLRGGTTA